MPKKLKDMNWEELDENFNRMVKNNRRNEKVILAILLVVLLGMAIL